MSTVAHVRFSNRPIGVKHFQTNHQKRGHRGVEKGVRGLEGTRGQVRRVAEEPSKFPGVAYAVSSDDLRAGAVARTPVTEAVLKNFNQDRSGDIYVVFEPHWYVAELDGKKVAGSHGSPWPYDSHVPVIWMGPGIEAGRRIGRRVETVDVAPTISAYLRFRPPSGSRGRAMEEVIEPVMKRNH